VNRASGPDPQVVASLVICAVNQRKTIATLEAQRDYLMGRYLHEAARRLASMSISLTDVQQLADLEAIRDREYKQSLMTDDDQIPLLNTTVGQLRLLGRQLRHTPPITTEQYFGLDTQPQEGGETT
jgi:hypothetical protein